MMRTLLLASTCLAYVAGGALNAFAYTAYISNEKDNSISVIDLDTLAVTRTIKTGQRPRGITLTSDGATILVCVGDDDTIQMIDAKSGEITGTLPSGPDPELLIVDRTTDLLYVSN